MKLYLRQILGECPTENTEVLVEFAIFQTQCPLYAAHSSVLVKCCHFFRSLNYIKKKRIQDSFEKGQEIIFILFASMLV